MSLSVGIVGLPNVGKSTLFNALTKKQAEAANYPFCTIEPNVGTVKVPDERLEKLALMSSADKIVPTIIEFVDIAGLVKGASEGEGLGNQFLSHIRECDAICQVVREFKDDNVIHVHNQVNPNDDRDTINLELVLADLATVTKRLDRTSKETRTGNKEIIKQAEFLAKLKAHLELGKPVRELGIINEDEVKLTKELNLLTIKSILYVLNTNNPDQEMVFSWDSVILPLNIKLEAEIASLPEDEQKMYIEELGLNQSGLDKLIKVAFDLLGLETFLTTGKIETRAWTIKKGTKAPQAASVIHTDFEKGFVRAEVINWQDLLDAGSESKAKEKGLIRIEGKEYIVKDGDVCNFLINQ